METSQPDGELTPPSATVAALPQRSMAWLLPVLAGAFVLFLGYRSMATRGMLISVHAAEGHGLKAGDPLRYRGTSTGTIERIELSPDLSEVVLAVRLSPGSEPIARAGSRFWVVRPQLSFDSVQGLETVIGAHYLAVLPGPGGADRHEDFVALEEPPVDEPIEAGGLEIVLAAPSRFSLSAGAPLTYRQIRIGTVLSVGLSSDATAVECRAYVRPAYAQLIRDNTVFWETGGIEIDLALMGGLKIDIQSLRSLLVGGIAVATPTFPGPIVSTGQRFTLDGDAPEGWKDWVPALPIGNEMLPADAPLPELQRASLTWRTSGLLARDKSRQGWVLGTEKGLLAPADLLFPEESVSPDSVQLEVAGQKLPMSPLTSGQRGRLAHIPIALDAGGLWPSRRMRFAEQAEDCLIVGDPALPMALATNRLTISNEGWKVDGALALDELWHGAGVVARVDGSLIGVLLFSDGEVDIQRLPKDWMD